MAQKKQEGKIGTLRSWPLSQRPRERLFRRGIGALSDAELLALFLRSGRRGENVHALSLRLLDSFGGLSGLARSSPKDLLKISGLGPAKAAALAASFEIGNRMLAERIEHRPLIASTEDLLRFLGRTLNHEREELFLAVLLNAKNELIKVLTLSRGDPTRVVVTVPSVMRSLLSEGSAAVIFVHNHPSGDPRPSPEDKRLTKSLEDACRAIDIAMHDHVIVGWKQGMENKGHFYSLALKRFFEIPPRLLSRKGM